MKRYRKFLPNPAPQQLAYAEELFDLFLNDSDTNTVTVSTGRCGLGKSTFVRSLINYFLLDDAGQFRGLDATGAIIITDMIKRVSNDYLGYNHDKYCAFITAKDEHPHHLLPAVQLSFAKNKPIVILTTQRYFSMDDCDREALFHYRLDNESEWRNRSIVIIDEKPYFSSVVELRINNFSRCDAALRCLPKDHPDKDWLIGEFKPFRDKMFDLLRNNERTKANSNRDIFFWFDTRTNNLTSDDEQFFKCLQAPKVRQCLLNEYPDFFRDMDSFKRLMTSGAFFIAVKPEASPKQRDETYFLLLQDNRRMFYLGEQAKFFVLDATADLDTDYRVDYVRLLDASAHNTDLALTINHHDVSTTKTAIINGDRAVAEERRSLLEQAIMPHIDNQHGTRTLVVTYKAIEDSFLADADTASFVRKGHFGGLRGINDLRDTTNMVVVGFNRKSTFDYYLQYVAQNPNELDKLRAMGEDKSRSYISKKLKQDKGVFVATELNEIMFGDILADFEQNIFRTAIRNYGNTSPVTIHTYWNCTAYAQLNQMIAERYGLYGVQIIDSGKPAVFQQYKTETRKTSGGKNNCQKVLEWLKEQPVNSVFTISDVRKEIGLTASEFKSTKQNIAVKDLLRKWSTDIDGTYKVS